MDSVNRSAVTPRKSRLACTFAKVLHIRAATTIDQVQKVKLHQKPIGKSLEDEKFQERAAMDAFIAKVFATLSSVKASYTQLQDAQSPYDAEGIQSADQIVVSEFKNLSKMAAEGGGGYSDLIEGGTGYEHVFLT